MASGVRRKSYRKYLDGDFEVPKRTLLRMSKRNENILADTKDNDGDEHNYIVGSDENMDEQPFLSVTGQDRSINDHCYATANGSAAVNNKEQSVQDFVMMDSQNDILDEGGYTDGSDASISEEQSTDFSEQPSSFLPKVDEDLSYSSETSSDESDTDVDDFENFDFLNTPKMKEKLPSAVLSSKEELFILALIFILKHKLSTTTASELFSLLNCIFGNIFPSSRYVMKKLYKENGRYLDRHFYCNMCYQYLGKKSQHSDCPNCKQKFLSTTLVHKYNFVLVDLVIQLKRIFSMFNFNTIVPNQTEYISDISDGSNYKKINNTDNSSKTLTLTFCTDGFPVTKSSHNSSIWPILLMVNELPHNVRFKNLLLGGLWFGSEPKMYLYLDAFCKKLNNFPCIIVNGVKINLKLVCCCVDSVARPVVQGSTQFNGRFGCSWCLHPGYLVDGVIKYPFKNLFFQDRQENETQQHMKNALDSGMSICGIKGPTPLLRCPTFNVVWGFCPDYMHCVLLGVCKLLLNLWFEGTGENYYIGNPSTQRVISFNLLKIKIPHNLQRQPRGIDCRKFWKASELRNWLLFFSLPCLNKILPSKYFNHYILLVKSIHTLLKEKISYPELKECDKMITEFVFKFQMLYNENHMNYNVHQLLHLAESVKRWGPLWSHSMFVFENENGHLKSLAHGTVAPHIQMANKFVLFNKLYLKFMEYPSLEKKFLSWKKLKYNHCSSQFLNEKKNPFTLNKDTLCSIFREPIFAFYKKIIIDTKMFSIDAASTVKTQNNLIETKDNKLLKILEICKTNSNKLLFICKKFKTSPAFDTMHIQRVVSEEDFTVIKYEDVLQKVLNIKINSVSYLICPPNQIENN